MYKRYITILLFFLVLVGCFFLFFDKKDNKKLYTEYFNKLDSTTHYNNLDENDNLNVKIDSDYINNQYHYVINFTSNSTLANFKALVIPSSNRENDFYPSFGIFDNKDISLVNNDAKKGETKGVNLVISNKQKVESLKVYVSYNNQEYYYLLNVGGNNAY